MSKKLNKFKGYILFESLLSLGIICFVVGQYILLNTFCLSKVKESQKQVEMYRILYEELNCYRGYQEEFSQMIERNNQEYKIHFYYRKSRLNEVEICDEKNTVVIKKEV